MIEADTIEQYALSIINAVNDNDLKAVYAVAHELLGHSRAYLTIDMTWELLKEDYERGLPPRKLAKKYSVDKREIYYRAHAERWASPSKLNKALKGGSRTVFYLVCRDCEREFEALSGHALVCSVCKAENRYRKGVLR